MPKPVSPLYKSTNKVDPLISPYFLRIFSVTQKKQHKIIMYRSQRKIGQNKKKNLKVKNTNYITRFKGRACDLIGWHWTELWSIIVISLRDHWSYHQTKWRNIIASEFFCHLQCHGLVALTEVTTTTTSTTIIITTTMSKSYLVFRIVIFFCSDLFVYLWFIYIGSNVGVRYTRQCINETSFNRLIAMQMADKWQLSDASELLLLMSLSLLLLSLLLL